MRLAWDSETKRQADAGYQRKRSDSPYHTNRWTRLSRAFRAEHPLCAQCLKEGRYVPAEVVDHIIPWPLCEDFYDRSNLQSLCADCNARKGIRDRETIFKAARNKKNK